MEPFQGMAFCCRDPRVASRLAGQPPGLNDFHPFRMVVRARCARRLLAARLSICNFQPATFNFQRSVRGTFLRRRCLTIKNWPKARGCSRFGPSYERTSSYRVGAPTGGQTPALERRLENLKFAHSL